VVTVKSSQEKFTRREVASQERHLRGARAQFREKPASWDDRARAEADGAQADRGCFTLSRPNGLVTLFPRPVKLGVEPACRTSGGSAPLPCPVPRLSFPPANLPCGYRTKPADYLLAENPTDKASTCCGARYRSLHGSPEPPWAQLFSGFHHQLVPILPALFWVCAFEPAPRNRKPAHGKKKSEVYPRGFEADEL